MKRLLPLLFLFSVWTAQAQGWRRTLDGLLNPADICLTPDGGAVLIANSVPGGTQDRQIVLTKTDQDGKVQWQKSLGDAGDDEGRAVILTADHQIAVAGKVSYLANNGDAVLALYDLSGKQLWERNYNYGVLDDAKCLRQLPDKGFMLAVEADNQLRLLRTDSLGEELWVKNYPSTNGLSVKHLELRADEGFVVTLLQNNLPVGAPVAVVLQIDPSGNIEFQTWLPHYSNYVTTDQVRCKPAGDSTFWLMHRDSVYLLDRDTTVLKRWKISLDQDVYLSDLIPAPDGGFFALGTNYTFSGTAFSRLFFGRYSADGAVFWLRYYDAPNFLHSSWAAKRAKDGGFFLSGNYAKNGGYFSYLIRTDSLGQAFTNEISGRVFWDKNKDCTLSTQEPLMKNWLLRITHPNGDLYYTLTDSAGYYNTQAGIGTYSLSLWLPNGLWTEPCPATPSVEFNAPFLSRLMDFPVQEDKLCPLLKVDAGIDYWVECAENQMVVRYSNPGTTTADDAAITLTLDSLLQVQGASIPFTQTGLHTWKFALPPVMPLADSIFSVSIQPECGAGALDRTLCAKVEIEPDDPCTSMLDGPLLIVDGYCDGDSIHFLVHNIGLPMPEAQPYIVVEDDIMYLQSPGALKLDAGETFPISFPANGATWRLEVMQAPGLPDESGDTHAAAVVEGCSANGMFSTGFVNQFSLYDGAYFYETECRPVVAEGQGNEKKAYPEGWQSEHYIQANTDLEYELHFRNTSGDSIHTLSLRDTLDFMTLDPASVIAGPASRPYQLSLSGTGILNFQFPQAQLGADERVWVKFRVQQQKDLPEGTVIRNRAWAYPGFSAPQPTNETFHTVLQMLSSGATTPPEEKPVCKIWPAPSTGDVHIESVQTGNKRCRIVDWSGRLVLERSFEGKELLIRDDELPRGMYLVVLLQGGQKLGGAPLLKF